MRRELYIEEEAIYCSVWVMMFPFRERPNSPNTAVRVDDLHEIGVKRGHDSAVLGLPEDPVDQLCVADGLGVYAMVPWGLAGCMVIIFVTAIIDAR